MPLEAKRRQSGMISDRWKDPGANTVGQALELAQPLARVAAARLVHRRQKTQQPRTLSLLEPVQEQRARQHTASFGPLHWHQSPVSLAQVAQRTIGVYLRCGVDDAQRSGGILAQHQVPDRWRVEVEHPREVLP